MRVQVRRTTTRRVTPPPAAGPSGASARYFARTAQRQQAAATRAALQGNRPPIPGAPGQLNPPTLTRQQKKWTLGCLGAAIGLFFLSALVAAIVDPPKTTPTAGTLPVAVSTSAPPTTVAPSPAPVSTTASPSPTPTPAPSPNSFKVGNYVGANLAAVESQLKAHGVNWTAHLVFGGTYSPDEYGADAFQICTQGSKNGTLLRLTPKPTIKLGVISTGTGCAAWRAGNSTSGGSGSSTTTGGSSGSTSGGTDGGSTGSSSGGSGAPAGATALCNDGTYSYSQHHSGTCSHHGGVAQWLN